MLAGLVLASLLTGCTGDAPEPEPSAQPTATVDVSSPEAGELRLTFEQHFGAALYLLLEGSRAPAPDREAVAAAADAQMAAVAETVSTTYDDKAGKRFERLWNRFTTAADDYRAAIAGGGNGGAPRRAVTDVADDLASFMAETTGGSMEVEGTQALVRAPTRDLLRSLEAAAQREHQTAYLHQREAFAEMIASGRAFAAGVAEQLPDQYPGLRNSGPLELRSALRQLFGEHTLLVTTVLRRGSKGSKDFAAAAAALNGNTGDVVAAIESIYGDAGDDLGGAWRGRISSLADYTVAAVEAPESRDEHRKTLRKSDAKVAQLLAAMSDDNIAAETATTDLRQLTQQLLTATDAYVKGEREDAQDAADDAYETSLEWADTLAGGIVKHRPEEFPTE